MPKSSAIRFSAETMLPPAPPDETLVRMTWAEICRQAEFRGRWIALDGCCYDQATGRATEGSVVDVDDDLVELCQRIRESDWRNCAILYCEDGIEGVA